MEKPLWRIRSSSYVVDSPHMRLRVDEIVLPDGTIVPNYYVRESHGFVVIAALTHDEHVVLVRQYRYGSDSIHLELPAGMLQDGEDPMSCARRELAEETGYEAARCDLVAEFFPEAVRSAARAYVFAATGAVKSREPRLEATEHLEVELATLPRFRALLRDGTIDAGPSIAAGYRVLDFLERLS
ncbi:MAG: NUDIX hydrolase [Candidatus Eremiobacteraeota bacterium]|nr:NUDIX hydrolase [Candidatus Eremiobacteraeota bacterium]